MKVGHAAWAFATPALLIISVFFFVPVLAALIVSLTDFDLYALADIRNLRFVGLDNYRNLLHTPQFWRAVANTGYFVAVGVPLSLAASLASALLVNSRLAYLAAFFRTAFFAPVVTTLVAVAVVWRYLLHTRYGLLNYALAHIGIHPIDWLGDPHWALPAIILFAVWKNFGYNMVIFLAALQSIPADLYEAARLDGASLWQEFRRITLPFLAPTMAITILLRTVWIANFADLIVIMTKGGPADSTQILSSYIFTQAFQRLDFGYASAVATVLLALLLAYAMALMVLRAALMRRS